jgi:hypothetical protein
VLNKPLTELLTEAPSRDRQAAVSDTLPTVSILGLATGAREVLRKRKDGETFSLELTGTSLMAGDEAVSVAFLRDVSKRKRAQRYLTAHYAATCILAEAEGLAEALPRILQVVSEALGWEAAAYWSVEPGADAECAQFYQAPMRRCRRGRKGR